MPQMHMQGKPPANIKKTQEREESFLKRQASSFKTNIITLSSFPKKELFPQFSSY